MIVPSVDVRGGRVAYRGGAGADEDPLALATRYVSDGATELHLVDLDGAERGEHANRRLLSSIAHEVHVPCRLAGGITYFAEVEEAFAAGFAGILLSSAVFGADDISLTALAAFGSRVIVEIEARAGALAPRGGHADDVRRAAGRDAVDAAKIAVDAGIGSLYVIDVSTDGRLAGPAVDLLDEIGRAVGPGVALHTGGGVRDLDDVRVLARWGAASVVIGRAFLERRFTLAEAMAACA